MKHDGQCKEQANDILPVKKIELPNKVLLEQVREVIREGHTATFYVKGYSMRPFLEHGRDKVVLAPFQSLLVGDAVLAEIAPGKYVLHRIVCMEGSRITLMGDGNLKGVELCRKENVIGVVEQYIRKGKTISASDKMLRKWVRIWRFCLPIRRYLLFAYKISYKLNT